MRNQTAIAMNKKTNQAGSGSALRKKLDPQKLMQIHNPALIFQCEFTSNRNKCTASETIQIYTVHLCIHDNFNTKMICPNKP